MRIETGVLVECIHETSCWEKDGLPDPIGPTYGEVDKVSGRRTTPFTDYLSLERFPRHWFRVDFFRPVPPDQKAVHNITFVTTNIRA